MTTVEKLDLYRADLEKHKRALQDNNPWGTRWIEPNAADYGLTSSTDVFMAYQIRKEILGE